MEAENGALLEQLMNTVGEITKMNDYKCVIRKQCCNFSRRLTLLTALFEELRDMKDAIEERELNALVSLKEALLSAKRLLSFCRNCSKIYLVLEWEQIKNKFQKLANHFEQALSGIFYKKFDISDEVKEQIELVQAQFKRGSERNVVLDLELYENLSSLYNQIDEVHIDPALLSILCKKLQLMCVEDLKQESLALHELVVNSKGDMERRIEKISKILKKIQDFLEAGKPNVNGSGKNYDPFSSNVEKNNLNARLPAVPDDFRCPISLELMKDPVIISTGQTYERACIKKWLEAGNVTCPKTQQIISNTTLTPNYALRSLIFSWCEANGVDFSKRSANLCLGISSCYAVRAEIDSLLTRLVSTDIEVQRAAAGDLRVLARHGTRNRISIAEAGGIPLLIGLLSAPDKNTQEHAVTALLNLSICEGNKRSIISANCLPGIIDVLQSGSMRARENAAATLFSLSSVDENKVIIGASGAIPALVALLGEGSRRGKMDAATAVFNLCIYQGNKVKAIKAGVIHILMALIKEPGSELMDESLAVMAILANHPDAKVEIGDLDAVPVLAELLASGSPSNRENATAVLVQLCAGNQKYLSDVSKLDLSGTLLYLSENGTERGKRKASLLLYLISRVHEQEEEAQTRADSLPLDITQPQPESSTENSMDSVRSSVSLRHLLLLDLD
ncbi:Armadillo [Dillenia turbinata]|uniref:U-box domain-containing protein 12 n=1 Tax=Dillenia turbinata TaxID=194707 RepID=A0AAN8W6Y5_9MAGN